MASQSEASEIAWPTIFFWMACLALNSIAQQSGRVLGTKYRHQAIFRSSPIICGFDAADILISWIAHAFSPTPRSKYRMYFNYWLGASPMPQGRIAGQGQALSSLDINPIHTYVPRSKFRHAATNVLLQRCVDKEGNPDLEGIARFRTQSGGRWLAFIIGVLPQLIKLFASRGIAWSQAAGAMYLASWLLFEFLVLAAQLENTAIQRIDEQCEPYRHEGIIRKIWAFAGMMLHAVAYSIPVKTHMDLINGTGSVLSYINTASPLIMFTFTLWWGAFFTPDYTPGLNVFQNLIIGAAFHFAYSSIPDSGGVAYVTILVVCYGGGEISLLYGYRWAGGFLVSLQVFNVITQPLFFYMRMYDPAGTYQFGWLRWLG